MGFWVKKVDLVFFKKMLFKMCSFALGYPFYREEMLVNRTEEKTKEE